MHAIINEFTEIHMDEKEISDSHLLSPFFAAKLRNMKVTLMRAKTNMIVNPQNLAEFYQQEAELQGQIHLIDQLIRENDEEVARREFLTRQQQGQGSSSPTP